jgi:hypothetical protein
MDLLREFDFEIKHIKGNENRVADSLSKSMKVVCLKDVSAIESDIKEKFKIAQETNAFFKTVTSYLKKQMFDDGLLNYKVLALGYGRL